MHTPTLRSPRLQQPALRLAHWLLPQFAAYHADEPLAGAFRARQLQAVLRLMPLTLLANLINAALIWLTFRGSPHAGLLTGWALLLLLVLGKGCLAWRRGVERKSVSQRAIRRASWHAAALAVLWAVPPLLLFSTASGEQQLLLATIAVGMMCAGGFALATLPIPGTLYALILGSASSFAVAQASFALARPIALLVAFYAFIVVCSVLVSARMFGSRMMAEAEAERQNQVIGLLLRDFEENASDVLWEIDARGHLCHISQRLASTFACTPAELASAPVIDLLAAMQSGLAEPDAGRLELARERLARGKPFRDLVVPVRRNDRTRWWSLTAKPLLDGRGHCTGWRGVATDVTASLSANRQLTWLAHYDPLTGLTNRHQFRTQLAELLTPASGTPRPCALLCLDLDHFKTVNDTLGHAVGDGLLQEIARRLQAGIRRSDTAARIGGDEFVVILRDVVDAGEATLLTRRLLDALHQPCDVQGASISVRVSIGIAMAPADGAQLDLLLNNADQALYAAKSEARGDLRFFVPEMATQSRRRQLVEHALRDALGRGELSLRFQPQVDLKRWTVSGFEALLHWQHPELGEVSPSEFIPVAEEAGLISEIGAWVLREACLQARRWPAGLHVAVNVSPVQAMSHDLCRTIAALLAELGIAAERLELEITESVFLDESPATMQVLNSLHQMGLRIALDDFGTGYSSLAYLRRFPFDTLKIDRAFIRELMTRRDARAIVKTILGLARTLQMTTVAEGVEEPAQVDVLRQYGCHAVQGFFVARPMVAHEIPRFLASWSSLPRPGPAEHPLTAPMPMPAG